MESARLLSKLVSSLFVYFSSFYSFLPNRHASLCQALNIFLGNDQICRSCGADLCDKCLKRNIGWYNALIPEDPKIRISFYISLLLSFLSLYSFQVSLMNCRCAASVQMESIKMTTWKNTLIIKWMDCRERDNPRKTERTSTNNKRRKRRTVITLAKAS